MISAQRPGHFPSLSCFLLGHDNQVSFSNHIFPVQPVLSSHSCPLHHGRDHDSENKVLHTPPEQDRNLANSRDLAAWLRRKVPFHMKVMVE